MNISSLGKKIFILLWKNFIIKVNMTKIFKYSAAIIEFDVSRKDIG